MRKKVAVVTVVLVGLFVGCAHAPKQPHAQPQFAIARTQTNAQALPPRQMEKLGRGVVAIKQAPGKVFVSWRMLGTDPEGIAFNIYRELNGNTVKLNSVPITDSTNWVDETAKIGLKYQHGWQDSWTWGGDETPEDREEYHYFVRSVVNGVESADSKAAAMKVNAKSLPYLSIPLQTPAGYAPNNAAVADLDGDGEYEIVVKQMMKSFDPSQKGVCPGTTKLEAYKLDGTFMWRIDLGPNIREGAHYSPFIVYDLDGDGRAEIAVRTSEGTVDGTGIKIGDINGDGKTNYVDNKTGFISEGPEFLSIFDGKTGKELARTDYIARGKVADWGDKPGKQVNRVDRFLMGVGYFDGERPSLLICRGYYELTKLEAWNWRDGKLSNVWKFSSSDARNKGYAKQGNHSLSIGDVNGDGKDEITYGACCIGPDGKGIYTTGLGHGDALHLTSIDPDRPGLQVFDAHENPSEIAGIECRDAETGELIWGKPSVGDVGRGLVADIDPRHKGLECWAVGGQGRKGEGLFNKKGDYIVSSLYDCKGNPITSRMPRSCNMAAWWDDTLLRSLVDKNHIDRWDYENEKLTPLVIAEGCVANNGTKATPAFAGDILGDWREEVIWRTENNKELRIYVSTIPSKHRFYTLMHDAVYRLMATVQNVGYNQPTHTGFYLGDGMQKPPCPNIRLAEPK
jgi:rhamnogalacturonan endolyase